MPHAEGGQGFRQPISAFHHWHPPPRHTLVVVRPVRGRRRVYSAPTTRSGGANLRRARRIRRAVPRSFRPPTRAEKQQGKLRAQRQIAQAEGQRRQYQQRIQRFVSRAVQGAPTKDPHIGGLIRQSAKGFHPQLGGLVNPKPFLAPAAKILEQTTRPIHGVAGAADAAVTGKNPIKGFTRGVTLKDKKLFSDVLRHVGAPKGVAAVAGFGLDVAADPLTHGSLSRVSAAEELARRAGSRAVAAGERRAIARAVPATKGVVLKAEKRAARRAIKQGKPLPAARQIGQQAAQVTQKTEGLRLRKQTLNRRAGRVEARVRAQVPSGQGVSLNFGKQATSGQATAKLLKKVPGQGSRPTGFARELGSTFSPNIAPPGVSREGFQAFKGASREARASAQRGGVQALQKARGLFKTIPEQHRGAVIDSIERGTVSELKNTKAFGDQAQQIHDAAQGIKQSFRQARRQELRAGVQTPQSSNVGYFRHQLQSALDEPPPKGAKAGYTIKPNFTGQRQYKTTLQKANVKLRQRAAGKQGLRPEQAGNPMAPAQEFSTDIPHLVAERLAASSRDVARAKLNRSVVQFGKELTKGSESSIKPGEVVVRTHGAKLEWHDPEGSKAIAQKVVNGEKVPPGRYAVVPEDFVKSKMRGVAPGAHFHAAERVVDKVTGRFKWLATVPNPAFHGRNLTGDIQNAYLAQPMTKLVPNIGRGAKGVRGLAKRERALAKGTKQPGKGSMVTVKDRYGRKFQVPLKAEVKKAEKAGAVRQGFVGRELGELTRRKKESLLTRGSQGREDLVRLATFLGARQKGQTAREAADKVANQHFDYGDLSATEQRVLRRVAPFYCVPESHEALTRRGFKRHDELELGEDVLSLDHETGEMEWTPLLDVARFDYDGPLKTMTRRGSKFLFTEDHRWPVLGDKRWGSKRTIKRAFELNRSDRVPLTGEFLGTDSILTPRQAAILGWLVGDGYFRWRGNHCEMLVYQSPKKYLEELTGLLATTPRAPHPDTGVVAVPVALTDTRALTFAGFASKEDLLRIVGQLSREAAEAMWDALFKAEGWTVPGTNERGFSQVDGPVLEAFQMLSLMTGRSCNLGPPRMGTNQPVRQAYMRTAESVYVGQLGEAHYTGTIWCPRTKHGTWVMRHEGAVIPTGNTWTSRDIPLQAKTLLSNPGKYANIEKLREETAKSQGIDLKDWQKKNLREFQGRALPVPLKKFAGQLSGLPLQDLNELPVSLDPTKWGDEQIKKLASMLNPGIKDPVELFSNTSLFFRSQLERDNSPLVSAPSYVAAFPPWLKKLAHVQKGIDRQSGKQVWMWRGKADYIAKAIPGPTSAGQQFITQGANRRGQQLPEKLLAYGTGVRLDRVDPASVHIDQLFKARNAIQKRLAELRQTGVGSASGGRRPNAEYRRLNRRLHQLESGISGASRQRGDKRPLLRRRGSGGGGGGLGGSGLGGSGLGGSGL